MSTPVYCSPEDAFKLSDCPDPWTFVQKLHRLLLEGMPSTARRNVLDSEREPVPHITWIDCRPILFKGEVLSKYFYRYHRHPDGRRTCERREFRAYGGPSLIGQTWVDDPRVWFVDLRFLTTDFKEAWAKSGSDALAPAPASASPTEEEVKDLIRAEAAKRGGFIAQKEGGESVREKFPGIRVVDARKYVKDVTRNEKTGPRGPRK
jgi:hypothetical protein